VPISEHIQVILNQYMLGRIGYVFPVVKTDDNRHVEAGVAVVNKALKLAGIRAGLPADVALKLTTHVARHTAAKHLDEAGVGLIGIKDTLGHKRTSSTHSYLVSLRDLNHKDILDKLG